VANTTFEAELAGNKPTNMFKALGGIIYTATTSVAIPAAFTAGGPVTWCSSRRPTGRSSA
jgi:hypothetical protein